jgi:hypothetical protein
MRRGLLLLIMSGVCVSAASAQWLNYPTPGVPRTRDGKPRLDAPAPRARDGRPDLTGVWMHVPTPREEMLRLFGAPIQEEAKVDVPGMEIGTQNKYAIDLLVDYTPENSPLRPDAGERLKRRLAAPPKSDLCSTDLVTPFPLAGLLSEPIKIVQAPRLTLVLYEVGNSHRQVFSDGRPLPRDINLPSFLGYSVGRWEKDTFVVETVGFNGKMTIDAVGHEHSDQLRITERFRRRNFGNLDVEMTFDDPQMLTRPFTIKVPHTLLADEDIFEMYPENERDCNRIGNN